MKTGDIVFLRRPYKGYRAVELMDLNSATLL